MSARQDDARGISRVARVEAIARPLIDKRECMRGNRDSYQAHQPVATKSWAGWCMGQASFGELLFPPGKERASRPLPANRACLSLSDDSKLGRRRSLSHPLLSPVPLSLRHTSSALLHNCNQNHPHIDKDPSDTRHARRASTAPQERRAGGPRCEGAGYVLRPASQVTALIMPSRVQ